MHAVEFSKSRLNLANTPLHYKNQASKSFEICVCRKYPVKKVYLSLSLLQQTMISEVYKDPRVVKNRKVQNLEALNHFSTVVIRCYCMEKITRKWLYVGLHKIIIEM